MTQAVGRSWPHRLLLFTFVLIAVLATFPQSASADEQRADRLNLMISMSITSLSPDLINDGVDELNEFTGGLNPPLAPIDHISAAPWVQAEGRFFISDRFVALVGAGYLERQESLELQPQPNVTVTALAQTQTVTIHTGLDYYFTPITVGDVTWRPFGGGGFMSAVESRGKVGGQIVDTDAMTSDDMFQRIKGEGAGFWVEGGVHLMIPGRWSFVGNLFYRYLKVPRVRAVDSQGSPGDYVLDDSGDFAELDLSGFGLRLGVSIDILDRF